jgi:hypothetical protein
MAKDQVVRQMTDEQRQRIMNTPGVVVHRNTGNSSWDFSREPVIRVRRSISVRELLGRDDDYIDESE